MRLIRAAGCVVWRPTATDERKIEVLLIHRDRYDDWSFPKGKLEGDETEQDCALRELHEETAITGELGTELTMVSYVDHKGRDKTVRYWALRFDSGEFLPNEEVDQVRWASVPAAGPVLSYEHDRALLAELLTTPEIVETLSS